VTRIRGDDGIRNVEAVMQIVYVDKKRCLGCFNCERACELYHFARDGVSRSYIRVNVDFESRVVQTSTCLQCRNAACVRACPTGALARNPDTGTIEVSLATCIGCGCCEEACHLGNVRIIPEMGVAGKCDLCGGEPQCVQACFARALLFGPLKTVLKTIRENRGRNLAIRAVGEEGAEGDS